MEKSKDESMKKPGDILINTPMNDFKSLWIIKAMKEYAKQWIDEAAEVAMKQCENGLPVGDAVYALKNEIDKQ